MHLDFQKEKRMKIGKGKHFPNLVKNLEIYELKEHNGQNTG